MAGTAFYSDERTFWHTAGSQVVVMPVGGFVQALAAGGFAESPESKRRLKNLLDVSGIARELRVVTADSATLDDVLRVHSQQYVDRFIAKCKLGYGSMGLEAPVIDAPVSHETLDFALLSAGLALAAVESVWTGESDNAYSLSRPPGHHCLPDKAMGFCYLANIAIAVENLKHKYGFKRIAIIDWDVHHGNGTQAIFENRSDVYTFSIHQAGCFPPGYEGTEDRGIGEGYGYNMNIPLPPGSGHECYMRCFSQIILPELYRYQPEMIIVASGYDASALDPPARMLLHSESFRQMTRMLKEAASEMCAGKLVIVHEGGYSEAHVPFCGLAVIEELTGYKTSVADPLYELIVQQQPSGAFHDFLLNHVDSLRVKLTEETYAQRP